LLVRHAACGTAGGGDALAIGGIGALAPERRSEVAELGLRAMVAGSLACFQTATIAGILIK